MTSNLTFINPSDAAWTQHRYVLAFGAYGSTVLCAHANSLENALDACVDWLEDNAPGMLCDDMVAEEYEAALRDGLTEDEAIERAEQDVTRAGNASGCILSWEWHILAEDPSRETILAIAGRL